MDFHPDNNRYSLAGGRPEDEDFTSQSKSTQESDNEQFNNDIRSSQMIRSRRPTKVTLHNFNIQKQIGRGAFGRVYLAELDVNKQLYAIKAIRKDVLIEHDQIESTLLEKDILFAADHPFLVGMDFLF